MTFCLSAPCTSITLTYLHDKCWSTDLSEVKALKKISHNNSQSFSLRGPILPPPRPDYSGSSPNSQGYSLPYCQYSLSVSLNSSLLNLLRYTAKCHFTPYLRILKMIQNLRKYSDPFQKLVDLSPTSRHSSLKMSSRSVCNFSR